MSPFGLACSFVPLRIALALLLPVFALACDRGALPAANLPGDGGAAADAGASLAAPCGFDDAPSQARPALLIRAGRDLLLLRSDRSSQLLVRFGEGLIDDKTRVSSIHVDGRDGLLAAEAWWPVPVAGGSRELVLLDLAGTVRYRRRGSGLEPMQPMLGPGGTLAFFDNARQAVVVDASGSETVLAGLSPLGPPGRDRKIAVRPVDLDARTGLGWYGLDTGLLEPLALPLWDHAAPQMLGERLVYVGDQGGRPAIVSERPGDLRIQPIDGTAGAVYLHVEEAQLRLVLTGPPHQDFAVDPVTLSRVEITAPIPPGLRPWRLSEGSRLDDGGGVIMALRDTYRGGLYRTPRPGQPLVQLGGSVSEVLVIRHAARAGTHVLVAGNDAFGGELEWPPAPTPATRADLPGESIQLVRPQSGIVRTLAHE